MTQIFLQPAGSDEAKNNFEKTIQNKISITEIKKDLTPSECAELTQVYAQTEIAVAVWGVLSNSNTDLYWDKMQNNDLVFFTGDNKIFARASVAYKLKQPNKKLAEKLWGTTKDGKTWEYIYFLKDIKDTDVPFDTVLNFSRVALNNRSNQEESTRYEKLLKAFPDLDNFSFQNIE